VLRLVLADAPPVVDGSLDDAAWTRARTATGFVQHTPDEGEPATHRTDVRLLHDGDALYVGARLHDHGDSIVARLARRDEAAHADWFTVYLDSYHDRRTAFAFAVSAAGVQRDVRVSDETQEDADWDAVWSSVVRRDEGGWTAELRIPLSQIRFDRAGTDGAWGVNFERFLARRNERAYWAPRPREDARFVSLFGRLEGVGALEPTRALEIVPYTSARLRTRTVNPADPFRSSAELSGSVGADLRMGLGHGLTLSATFNPDFGQVEADPATVNLSAFETFQRERRPFFVEGGDIFELAFPVWPPFFYSRRIGRSPSGSAPGDAAWSDAPEASTILGAVKVSGKTEGGWSLGLLEAVTAREEVRWVDSRGDRSSREAEPATTHTVARVVRRLREGRTGFGLVATATRRRIGDPSLRRLRTGAYGLAFDGWHRFAGDAWELRWGLLGSHVRGDTSAIRRTQTAPGHWFQRPDADHLELDPDRRSLTGTSLNARLMKRDGNWKTGASVAVTTPSYEISDLGFNPSLDRVQSHAWLRYEDYTPGRLFRQWRLGGSTMMQSTTGGELDELTGDLGFFFTLPSWWGGGVWVMRHQPAWDVDVLRGGPALRKPGHWMGNVSVNSDPRRTFGGDAFLFWDVEDEGGGHRVNGDVGLELRPSERSRVSLGAGFSTSRNSWQWVARGSDGGETVDLLADLDRTTLSLPVRVDYTFSPTLTLQAYARPFLAAGEYGGLKEVVDPGAPSFADRFRVHPAFAVRRVRTEDGSLRTVDRDGDGLPDLTLPEPDFNRRSLQLNAVLRWQYRPGSTLYAVWTHDRSVVDDAAFDLGRDLDVLGRGPGRNVFMLKATWWMGP
jgi:hypothetical protein